LDYAELKDLQSLPLKYKVMITKQRIQEWYEHWKGQVYVSFSGGKDSTVLLNIVRELYPDVPAVFVDTGLEYPEIRRFVKKHENVVWLKPRMNFKRVIEKYGYPVISKEQSQFLFQIRTSSSEKLRKIRLEGNKYGRGKVSEQWKYLIKSPFPISHKCCEVMKKSPFARYEKETGNKPYIGVMASESSMREIDYIKNGGCNFYETSRAKSWPIGFWNDSDIWEYLNIFNVPYCSVYDMGYTRTGCMFCMFGVHLEPEPNRFQKMQVTHPKLWAYCTGGGQMVNGKWVPNSEGLGIGFVLDYIGVRWKNDEGLWPMKELIGM